MLAEKFGHPVFATLARRVLRQTLNQQNRHLKINGEFNPPCSWASRIYSDDGKTPISFLVNQAMISASLIKTCDLLGDDCPRNLKNRVVSNAICLVHSYEPLFDQKTGLYRIPLGANFRFDGIWAPWNWQMSWLPVLERVGRENQNTTLVERATSIAKRFLKSWEISNKGALWRYWVPQYYSGWTEEMGVSKSRPIQQKHKPKRYEDISHAGISLIGLNDHSSALPKHLRASLQMTLNRLLLGNLMTPRDLDGRGPQGSRWFPGAGFDAHTTPRFRQFYERKLPGNASTDQHLVYANLIDTRKPVKVKLSLQNCEERGCAQLESWHLKSLSDLLNRNPLFSIRKF